MTTAFKNLYQYFCPGISRGIGGAVCAAVIALVACPAPAASVVQRGTTARPTVSRVNNASRMPTMTVRQSDDQIQEDTSTETTTEPDETPVEEETIVIEDKSSQFDAVLNTSSADTSADTSETELAEMIRRQRAALDSQDATTTASQNMQNALAANQNACDIALRACMQNKCGSDFFKCKGDTDTTWGNKMDTCRRDTKCTGEEYKLFAAEIKADRDMNARLSAYDKILECGNNYNDCIVTQCGTTYSKCLGKTAGDAAIAACATIAKNCTQQDNGLANRTMQVFATLRQDAEVQVKKDEERLYALRDQMAEQCRMLGAMFDDRTLDCVYTVEFYAGDDSTLFASKKAYAGNTFDCTPNWFGIDITTFKENAYRLTREQKSATSSLLGSGVGMAVGSITSGAIGRAIDRQKAEKALKNAEKEHEENYGDKSSDGAKQNTDKKSDASDAQKKDADGDKTEKSTSSSRPNDDQLKAGCESVGGTYSNGYCSNPKCGDGQIYDDWTGKCKQNPNMEISDQKSRCELGGGIWSVTTCMCPNAGKWNSQTGMCEAAPKLELDTSLSNISLSGNNNNASSLLNPSSTGGINSGVNLLNVGKTPSVSSRSVTTRK